MKVAHNVWTFKVHLAEHSLHIESDTQQIPGYYVLPCVLLCAPPFVHWAGVRPSH